jgi:glyoxylase-like metal-dependent hydrolase (beta-lactamase superfamily II)
MSESLKFNTVMHFAYGVPDRMAPGVVRLVAPNGGPLTFKGTNTYLVGDDVLAVIDPGPDDAAHRDAILAAAAGRPIAHILATHAHRDHVDGMVALKVATGARTYGYRRSAIAEGGGGDPDAEYVGHDFVPDVHVEDGDVVGEEGWRLSALHTPGHAPDHLCLALAPQGIIFSGDHVMAWNTSVIAPPEGRMSDYMRSLELLLAREEKMLLPGHGGAVEEAKRTVKAYLLHRKWREQAILEAVRKGTNTVRTLLPVIYRDLDRAVVGAAALSLRAHIDHLAERGLIACDDSSNVDCVAVPL